MRPRVSAIACALLLASAGGCMNRPNARYIYQDGEFGVIGIPQNSPLGAQNYRKQAEALMALHFPDGYEIVRAEEVVEGQRVLDKSRKSEFETDPTIDAMNQKIQLGKLAQTVSTQQKDSLPILESRIIYRRRAAGGPPGVNGYASTAELIPKLYLDPNEMARCRERIELAELKKSRDAALASGKTADPEAKQAAHEATPPPPEKADPKPAKPGP